MIIEIPNDLIDISFKLKEEVLRNKKLPDNEKNGTLSEIYRYYIGDIVSRIILSEYEQCIRIN